MAMTYSFNRLQLEIFYLSEEVQASKGRQDVCDEGRLTLVVDELLQPLQVTVAEVKLQLHHAETWECNKFASSSRPQNFNFGRGTNLALLFIFQSILMMIMVLLFFSIIIMSVLIFSSLP